MRQFIAICLIGALIIGLIWLSKQDPTLTPVTGSIGTPQPGGFDLILGNLSANATADAASRQVTQANGDALAYQAAMTAEAQAQSVQRTATAVELTRLADGTATQQAWVLVQLTVDAAQRRDTAEAQASGTASAYTATAITGDVASTQVSRDYYQGVLQRAAVRDELQNEALAKGPIYLTIIAVVAILMVGAVALVKYWRRPQTIPRNAWGDAPLLWDNQDDLIDPDRLPTGLVRLLKGLVQAPMLADAEVQERTVARDQSVDLATRGIPGQPTAPRVPQRQAASSTMMPPANGTINFRVLQPGEVPTELRDPEKMAALDVEWKESK